MTSIDKAPDVQPRPQTARLNNNAEITITSGIWCPICGDDIRAIDAEPLDDDAVRLICECGHLILQHEPRPGT
jgi:hypothetical protein